MSPERATRRFHRKSKNGCYSCKQRHKRCDEQHPVCGNCLKYGRTCNFPEVHAAQAQDQVELYIQRQQLADDPVLSYINRDAAVVTYEQQWDELEEWLLSEGPNCYVNHIGAIFDSTESSLVMEYQNTIPNMRIMPRCREQVIVGIATTYLQLACEYETNRHSFLSLAGTFHYRDTQDPRFINFTIYHRQLAIRNLQREIEHFSPQNADSILAASMNLSNQSADWQEWLCYTQGISTVLQTIKAWNRKTVFESHVRNPFALREVDKYQSQWAFPLISHYDGNLSIVSIISSLRSLRNVIPLPQYLEAGFPELEVVCLNTLKAFDLTTEVDRFRQTDLLRMWLYYFPNSPRFENLDYDRLLRLHFYALVLASIPLFPRKMQETIIRICERSIMEFWTQNVGTEFFDVIFPRPILQALRQPSPSQDPSQAIASASPSSSSSLSETSL